jgi:hypothetical protein
VKAGQVERLLFRKEPRIFAVEIYAAVRLLVFIDGNSRREAVQVFRLNRETIAKLCLFSLSPGYPHTKPIKKRKLGPAAAGDRCDPRGGPVPPAVCEIPI